MCDRLIQLSFAKIVKSKNERGGAKLRKNLLILRLLQNARNEMKNGRTNQFQATEEVSPVDVECEENTSQQSAEIDCILINNTNNNENSLPSVTTTAEEVEKESNNNTQDNNNCSMISTNEHISDTSSDSYSNYCSKRKLSGVDIVEQSSRCSKKLCFSQTIIVGNFQIQCPSVVPVACPIY